MNTACAHMRCSIHYTMVTYGSILLIKGNDNFTNKNIIILWKLWIYGLMLCIFHFYFFFISNECVALAIVFLTEFKMIMALSPSTQNKIRRKEFYFLFYIIGFIILSAFLVILKMDSIQSSVNYKESNMHVTLLSFLHSLTSIYCSCSNDSIYC